MEIKIYFSLMNNHLLIHYCNNITGGEESLSKVWVGWSITVNCSSDLYLCFSVKTEGPVFRWGSSDRVLWEVSIVHVFWRVKKVNSEKGEKSEKNISLVDLLFAQIKWSRQLFSAHWKREQGSGCHFRLDDGEFQKSCLGKLCNNSSFIITRE